MTEVACPASALTSRAHVGCTSVCRCGGHTERLLQGGLPSLLFSQVPELVFSLLFREHLNLCHRHRALFEQLKVKMIFPFSPGPVVTCRIEPSWQKVICVLALHHLNPAPPSRSPDPHPGSPGVCPGPWVNSISGRLSCVHGAGRDCPGPCYSTFPSWAPSFIKILPGPFYDRDGQV